MPKEGEGNTHEDVKRRLVEKWHARECSCRNPECPHRISAAKRADTARDLIGTALRKALANDGR